MTREEELRVIEEVVRSGDPRYHRITAEEMWEYMLRQERAVSDASAARMRQVNFKVGNAMSRLKRERAYARGEAVQP